jgi:hypothetical protein
MQLLPNKILDKSKSILITVCGQSDYAFNDVKIVWFLYEIV